MDDTQAYIIIPLPGVEFVELDDPEGRSMSSFGLGAMTRSGFPHMGKPKLPNFFSVGVQDVILASLL